MSSNVTYEVLLGKKPEQGHEDDGLVELMEALESIDETKPIAKINETSISDGNGGRILL